MDVSPISSKVYNSYDRSPYVMKTVALIHKSKVERIPCGKPPTMLKNTVGVTPPQKTRYVITRRGIAPPIKNDVEKVLIRN